MYSLGVDVGYSSVKLALTEKGGRMVFSRYRMHRGHIKKTVRTLMEELFSLYAPEDILHGAATGSGSRFLVQRGVMHGVNEVTALIEGCTHMGFSFGSLAEIGGKNATYVTGFRGASGAPEISMNSGCSAGTGSFLEEQMSRLHLPLEEYSRLVERARSVPRIAGRCSVFAKTDMVHHQQEGTPVEDILLGLAYGVVQNYRTGVMKKLPLELPLLFVGGVSQNQGIIRALRDILKLSPENLLVPEHAELPSAFGASLLGWEEKYPLSPESVLKCTEEADTPLFDDYGTTPLKELSGFGKKDSLGKHRMLREHPDSEKKVTECALGIDVGSTSTNLVLIDRKGKVRAHRYIATMGKPFEALQQGFRELSLEFPRNLSIIGAGITGSGRHLIGTLVGADVVKDEITAQAKAAVTLDPEVDTIFEIGGQDSKFIRISKGRVVDFQMNKICAAGTGSFIEEQAKKLNIPLESFGDLALQGKNPVNLGDRCTVFIETSLGAHLAKETPLEDIASGLCYSIVRNYLHRVVGQKEIGHKIFFQGGLAYNQGVVNAFRSLMEQEISVPPFFSVTGAYGAALFALEEDRGVSSFKGLALDIRRAFENSPPPAKKKSLRGFSLREGEFIFKGYAPPKKSSRKTVGMPRALFTFGMYPMFRVFFEELGFDLILSNPTSEETIRKGQAYALEETCYPVKLINGHVAELVERGVDYIFFPDLYTVPHPGSPSRQNYGCPYMQLAFKMVNRAMDLEKRGIPLLAPTIAFSLGEDFMRRSFLDLGKKLHRSEAEIMEALRKSSKAYHDFEKSLGARTKEVFEELPRDARVFVIISKIYGVLDPVLNLGIPEFLEERRHRVIPFYSLPEVDLSKEHPNMYWPFGQHILEAARFVKEHPNFYAIFLSHHGCGPDSAFSHYFQEIMGDKPYLHVEVDEHASPVGVITRMEAFLHSLSKIPVETRVPEPSVLLERMEHSQRDLLEDFDLLPQEGVLYLPHLYPYGELGKEALLSLGIHAECCPRTTGKSLDCGRKHTMTNEYLSLTSLLGDVMHICATRKEDDPAPAFLVPRNEGAEVGGQFSRLLGAALDKEGYSRVRIVSPFLEDLLHLEESRRNLLFRVLLGGDLVKLAPLKKRNILLLSLMDSLRQGTFSLKTLLPLAEEVREAWKTEEPLGTLFATGELSILHNDFLNGFLLSKIEKKGYRVVYSPLSEALWLFWRDYVDQNLSSSREARKKLEDWKEEMASLASALGERACFEKDPENLVQRATESLGYYAGAFGRYREAKILGPLPGIQGILTLASTYENTGISLQGLHKGFQKAGSLPVLHLCFDGHEDENDTVRIETFLHYLEKKNSPGLFFRNMMQKEGSRS